MPSKKEQLKEFFKVLQPAIGDPFKETKKESDPENIKSRLEELEAEEKYVRKTYRLIQAAGIEEFKHKLEEELKESQQDPHSFYISKLGEGLKFFSKFELLKSLAGYFKNISFDYFARQYRDQSKPVVIESELDKEIPLEEWRLADYLSFMVFWVAELLFLNKKFGDKVVMEGAKFVTDLAGFYAESGVVFKQAQTTVHRGGEGGAALSFLREIDKSRNMFPSLHAEITAHTYSRFSNIIDSQTQNKEFQPVKDRLLKRATRILEACLLTKQHSLKDIAAGLAAVSARDPGFTKEKASFLVDQMFTEDSAGMEQEKVLRIRDEIKSVYSDLMSKIELDPSRDYSKVFIEYIKSIEQESRL